MTQHYLKRGYPQDLITQSRHKAFAVLHHDLIHKPVTKRATMNRLPLVLTYNLTNPDIIGLVTKFWPILQTSVKGAILFKDPPVRAFRRSPNLRDHLVKAVLKSNTPKTTPYPKQSIVKNRTVKPANLSKDDTNCLRTTGSTISQKTSIVKPTMSSISWNAHIVKNNMSAKQSETSLHDSRNILLISDITGTHRSLNISIWTHTKRQPHRHNQSQQS